MQITPFISCYADVNGFGIVAGLKKQIRNEIYLTFLEDDFIDKVSFPLILNKLAEYRDRYKVEQGYANSNLKYIIDKTDIVGIYWKYPELDLDRMIFVVTCLVNDEKIQASRGYSKRMLEVINSFDKDIVNHISYALMYGIDLTPDPTYWLSML